MDVERRNTAAPLELRAKQASRTIGGYAAKFGKLSQNLGGFVEQIDRGAFTKSAGDGWPGVMARYNHDDFALLGTTAAGTLRLAVDDTGIDYEADLPDTSVGRDLAVLVERGDVTRSSFAFYTLEDDWGLTDQGFPLRTLLSARLVDVAPVNTPAYMDTSTGLRSLALAKDADPDEVRALAASGDLARLLRPTPTVLDLAPDEQRDTHSPRRLAALRRLHDLRR